jgi:hypothetical protein
MLQHTYSHRMLQHTYSRGMLQHGLRYHATEVPCTLGARANLSCSIARDFFLRTDGAAKGGAVSVQVPWFMHLSDDESLACIGCWQMENLDATWATNPIGAGETITTELPLACIQVRTRSLLGPLILVVLSLQHLYRSI